MVVGDADIAPFEVHGEVFHVPIDSSVQFAALVIFDPSVGGRGEVTEGDNDELAAGPEKSAYFVAGGFEVKDINEC